MYEVQTYDVILRRILNRLPENEDVRPSSPLYIASGPAAKEIETVYGEMDYTLDQIFPTTANREYLIKHAKTYRIEPYKATKAIVEGEFDVELDKGTRFKKDGITFIVKEKVERPSLQYVYYSLECEETGVVGNVLSGPLVPDTTITDLTHAFLTRILVPGEDDEDTESFRERFIASFNSQSFGGNLADYLQKVTSLEGVGRAKILRCVDFEGNVKPEWVGIVFTDALYEKPSEELVDEVQEQLQPLGVSGYPELETCGLGLAPIGHLVTVRGVKEEKIDVSLKLTYEAGYDWKTLKDTITETLNEYLKSESKKWGETVANSNAKKPFETHISIVRARIESLLINTDGILDANDTMICGEFDNYELEWDAIPVLGEVTEHNETDIREGINTCPYNCPDCAYQRDMSKCPRVLEALDG